VLLTGCLKGGKMIDYLFFRLVFFERGQFFLPCAFVIDEAKCVVFCVDDED
jgi:hypothetical protein